jgi:hypothetical protein
MVNIRAVSIFKVFDRGDKVDCGIGGVDVPARQATWASGPVRHNPMPELTLSAR